MKKTVGLALLGSVLATSSGCCQNLHRRPAPPPPVAPAPCPVPCQPGMLQPGVVQPGIPQPMAPRVAPGGIPPGGIPVAPPPGPGAPFPTAPAAPPANPNAFPTAPPAPVPPGGGGLPPTDRVEYRWQPAEGKVQLGGPEPIPGQAGNGQGDNGQGGAIKLYPPEAGAPDKNAPKTTEPPIAKIQSATALPVGIPQFASVRDNVSAGLRPSLDDGLDWLQAKGYRTVLHIRLPGEDDNADRKQVEKRGLKYVALEVSPQTLTKMTVDEFNRMLRDVGAQPLFVYDRDAALAGALWYLHFRTSEQLPDDAARIRARGLGFREDQDGPHRDMWLAVQKHLEKNDE